MRETTITIREDTFVLGLSTDEPDRFQGFHCPDILIVVDEASGVPEPIFEAIDGVLTTAGARLLLIGNPTRPTGCFAESHRLPAWRKIHISAPTTRCYRSPGSKRWRAASRHWRNAPPRRVGGTETAFRCLLR